MTNPPADNKQQIDSASFRLPVTDADFLLGDSMRGVRFLIEYAKAEEALRKWGIRSTIVVFGSARVREDGPKRHANWYNQARSFARIVSERGGALLKDGPMRDNVIATGGGPGLMEAANRGASDAGAPSIGFNIGLPQEQEPNAYSTPDLTFRFHYFAMRKMHLAMRANALVVFPGGFGTFDELFEVVTLQADTPLAADPDSAVRRGILALGRPFRQDRRCGHGDARRTQAVRIRPRSGRRVESSRTRQPEFPAAVFIAEPDGRAADALVNEHDLVRKPVPTLR